MSKEELVEVLEQIVFQCIETPEGFEANALGLISSKAQKAIIQAEKRRDQ